MRLLLMLVTIAFAVPAVPVHAGGKQVRKGDKTPPIVTTESGLRVQDLKDGTGAAPTAGQIAVIHYVGKLEDGTEFDSSRARNTPFQFKVGVGQVIKGFDEAVMGMKVGGLRKVWIPASLGYGQKAMGKIPAGATLVFEIELLALKNP
jgi:peptidylprolyl isomerase